MLTYFPALRLKQGEYYAAGRLARDVQQHVCPRFIIPPPREQDPERGTPLTADEIAHLAGDRIGKHWPLYPAFLDAQHVEPLLGDDGLTRLFCTAQRRNEKLAVVASVENLFKPLFRRLLLPQGPKIGVYLPYERFDGRMLMEGLKSVGCTAEECVLFVDFTGMPFDIQGVAGSVAGLFDELGTCARWNKIIFQGSTFPVKNKAPSNGKLSITRHEWDVFFGAIAESVIPPDLIGYGDFGADCGHIRFSRKGGGAPIRHLRYTTRNATIIFRGSEAGTQRDAMVDVCKRVINSGDYAGQGFCYADDQIWRMANGLIPTGATPSIWREWNMAHHMTRIVTDLGSKAGVTFAKGHSSRVVEQRDLWEK